MDGLSQIDPAVQAAFDLNKGVKLAARLTGGVTGLKAVPFSSTAKAVLEGGINDASTGLGVASDALRVIAAIPDNPVSIASDATWVAGRAADWAKDYQPKNSSDISSDATGSIDSLANGINMTREAVETGMDAAKPYVQAAYDKVKMDDPNSAASDASGSLDALRNLGNGVMWLVGAGPKDTPAPVEAPPAVAVADPMQGYKGSPRAQARELRMQSASIAPPPPKQQPDPDPVPVAPQPETPTIDQVAEKAALNGRPMSLPASFSFSP